MTESAEQANEPILSSSRAVTRRRALAGGVAAVAVTGFPYVSPGYAAQTLKFWQFYSPGGGVASQDKWFQDLVKGWNDSHDVKVELVYVPNNAYMDGTKLQTAFAAGAGPDLFIISPGDFLRYYNGGVLLELTPLMEQAARDDFYPNVIASRMVNGKIYALPMEVEPMAMYYSIDAFNEAGLTEKDVPKTWAELLDVAKKLTTPKRFGVLFETSPGYYQNFTWYPFFWEGGGDFQTKEGKSAFNSPAAVQALKFWQDAVNMGVAPRKPQGGGGWDSVPNLGSGYCAMQNVGIWAIAQLREGAPNFKYGVFRLPTPPGGKYITIGGGWAFCANSKGWNSKAAGEFCVWALGSMKPESVEHVVDWCTQAKSDMPPRKSALKAGEAAYGSGFLKVFADEIYPGARGEPRMPPQVYKAISDAIQSCQLGGANPEQAAATASQQIDAFLAGYRGAPII
ncbi:MAG TPA: sugar ABC transporter substrate-binding protein [Roseiarcus sp.]|nr:sugar ABC transporter substrate-binding protein [Roseiarcus sp.]